MASLEADLARVRQRVSKALIAATTHARAIHDRAQREAEVILRKARAEADKWTEKADRIDRERDEAERELPLPTSRHDPGRFRAANLGLRASGAA